MNNVRQQALLDAKREMAAAYLEKAITTALEDGSDLSQFFLLDFDPMEANYAS